MYSNKNENPVFRVFIKRCFVGLTLYLCCLTSAFGHPLSDSLQQELSHINSDSARVEWYLKMCDGSIAEKSIVYITPALNIVNKQLHVQGTTNERTAWLCRKALLYTYLNLFHQSLGDSTAQLKALREQADMCRELKNVQLTFDNLMHMASCYYDHGNTPQAIQYYLQALEFAQAQHSKSLVAQAHQLMAMMFLQSESPRNAIDYFRQSCRAYQDIGDTMQLAWGIRQIGVCYSALQQLDSAMIFFRKALRFYSDHPRQQVSTYQKMADACKIVSQYDSAVFYYKRAQLLAEQVGFTDTYYRNILRIGNTYRDAGAYDSAQVYILKAYRVALDQGQEAGIFWSNYSLVKLYFAQSDYTDALNAFQPVYRYAQAHPDRSYLVDVEHMAFSLDSVTGNSKGALQHYHTYIRLRDKYNTEDLNKQATREKYVAEAEQERARQSIKDALMLSETKRQQLIRNGFVVGFVLVAFVAVFILRQRNMIAAAKQRSEELLLNILPAETAEELKATGSARARYFEAATVMFTDFKNFTRFSETLSPAALVYEIHYYFSAFDSIVSRHGIEKIKTIGDAYMCVGGVPVTSDTHAQDAVEAALEIATFVEEEKRKRLADGRPFFEIRIGIHTGPIVAGVVGTDKFSYDVWGDTVNVASRMESAGEPGKINISGDTYALIRHVYVCTSRGKIPVKNKGEMDMYFLDAGH